MTRAMSLDKIYFTERYDSLRFLKGIAIKMQELMKVKRNSGMTVFTLGKTKILTFYKIRDKIYNLYQLSQSKIKKYF